MKSDTQHLKCVLDQGKIILTLDEFATIPCQVEACLNLIPLVPLPLSNNHDDFKTLTPRHFLVQRPLIAIPGVDRAQGSLYERWHQLKAIHHTF